MDVTFFALTFEYTEDAAADAAANAGGRGTQDELTSFIQASRFRQRVHAKNVAAHIAGMWAQGYRVTDVIASVSPIA